MTMDDDPAAVAELDRLAEAVRSAPAGDTTAQIALWRQATRLDTWFFIARGPGDRPRPYAVAAAQGPMICLYSGADRAKEAALALGLAAEGDAVPLLGVPVPAAIDYLASFGAAGVVGVALDHPRIGHHVPLANLSLLKAWAVADAE
ncbi:hypothetical protein JOE63_002313 [Cellulosimicrobium cellulans]|jgi:hypothetical protein|uniref:SseB protein N-terminal domain-containing protein n=1 Tax=Cellulosimicrobium cellulans TaxID=1710 RepID=A0A1Y0HY10_CELCE|nr:hypothetical protein [Cellulosimicrobium cellulans]ARU53062.1 hypothetical protein CBR64_18090 [Cellulosimicrobium cellulans]MBM7819836.1 hypothetical protein [Cellulosimicrobium cellulans]